MQVDVRDTGSIPGSRRSTGGKHVNTLQYSMGFPGGSDGKEPACNTGDPLEKGMAIPSSVLAWGIPWTEEPGGLESMG